MEEKRLFQNKINIARSLLKDQAYKLIKDAISNGELTPGKFYSQDKLSNELGISRTPVREAILELQSEGILVIHRGRGIEVVSLSRKDLWEIFEMRRALEVRACEMAAEKIGSELYQKLDQIIEMQKESVLQEDKTEFLAGDKQFHEIIAEAAENTRMFNAIKDLRDKITYVGAYAIFRSNRMSEIIKEHQKIVEALKLKDPQKVRLALEKHLEGTFGEIIDALKEKKLVIPDENEK